MVSCAEWIGSDGGLPHDNGRTLAMKDSIYFFITDVSQRQVYMHVMRFAAATVLDKHSRHYQRQRLKAPLTFEGHSSAN